LKYESVVHSWIHELGVEEREGTRKGRRRRRRRRKRTRPSLIQVKPYRWRRRGVFASSSWNPLRAKEKNSK